MGNDAKMREMQHFVGSHEHDDRLRAAAELRRKAMGGIPEDVCRETEILRRMEAREDGKSMIDPTAHVDSRLQWREEMDRGLRRLMLDTELACDGRIGKDAQHEMRCGHVDRMHDWYEKHGMKQARKEREAPHFLRYDAAAPVMPGSLRTAQHEAPALRVARPHSLPPGYKPSSPKNSTSTTRPDSRTQVERPRSTALMGVGRQSSMPTIPTMPSSDPTSMPSSDPMNQTKPGLWRI